MHKKRALLILLIAYVTYKYFNWYADSPIVTISTGKLLGRVSYSRDGREFYEYLGIPYAKPPIGELRFESPQASEQWRSIRNAQKLGAECAQFNIILENEPIGDEDCLFLNVHSPKLTKNSKLPVLVFIHGGLFVSGSSNVYKPNYFMDEDVVLVTINYRVGSLGFLNTNDGIIRGNMGLKDQVMALKFVQQNIVQFGGDPEQVTIFGESAGAGSVHHLVLSPTSKGLFQGAISQSGTALDAWGVKMNPGEQAKRFAERLNCSASDKHETVKCLKALPVHKILESHREIMNPFRKLISLFGPSVEIGDDDDTFMSQHPASIIRSGNSNKVRWMAGMTSEEGQAFSTVIIRDEENLKIFNENFTSVMPDFIFYDQGDTVHKVKLMEKVRNYYFGKGEKIDTFEKFDNYTNLITDYVWGLGLSDSIKLHSQFTKQPVYAYYFNYAGEFSTTSLMMSVTGKYSTHVEALIYLTKKYFGISDEYEGVCHGAELFLLFNLNPLASTEPTSREYRMSKDLIKLWVSFARNEKLSFQGIEWPPVGKDDKMVRYIQLDVQSALIPEPNKKRLDFWREDSLYTDHFKS